MTTLEAESHPDASNSELLNWETHFYDMFPDDPNAEELNVAMAFNVLARENRNIYAMRAETPQPWTLGPDAQGAYAVFIRALANAGRDHLAGAQPTTVWHRIIGILEARRSTTAADSFDIDVAHIERVAELQEAFGRNPHNVTGDNLYTLYTFGRLVRMITEDTVAERLRPAYLEADIVPPASLVDPALLRDFTDINYWRSDDELLLGSRRHAKKGGSFIAMSMISIHQLLTGQDIPAEPPA